MIQKYEEDLTRIACDIHDHPESGFQEFTASKLQQDYLKEQGFTVTPNAADTITGYTAVWGSGRPVIALLGEFDALHGLSQKSDVTKPEPSDTEMGHGCGHHLLGTGSLGAGLLIRDYLQENHLSGTVMICGCPGEEAGSGKAYMARDGIFADVDVALSWHPGVYNEVSTGSSQSCINVFYRFHGVSSHAAGAPEKGRSALDAVELMDVGCNYLREHMKDSDRIHYAIVNTGGAAPNVVQSLAEVNYFIRSANNADCLALASRVHDIARGAALMTGTTVEILFDEGLSNTVNNFVLEDVIDRAFRKAGVPAFDEADRAYAQAFKDTWKQPVTLADIPQEVKDKPRLLKNMQESPLCDYYVETNHSDTVRMGSTDVGDVSWVVPTAQLHTACYGYGAGGHSWQWVAEGKSPIAMKGMLKAAEVMALAAEELYTHPEEIVKAKEEFKERTGGQPYQCLIPKEVKPHTTH